MAQYKFDILVSTNKHGAAVGIDTAALYGYWERWDGSEGGGLWFERLPDGKLNLTDFDGGTELPARVLQALVAQGVTVDPEFF